MDRWSLLDRNHVLLSLGWCNRWDWLWRWLRCWRGLGRHGRHRKSLGGLNRR